MPPLASAFTWFWRLHLTACPDCDLLQTLPPLPSGGKASCARCGAVLARGVRDPIQTPLALTVAALLVLVIANTAPLMGLSAVGRQASTTIPGGALRMWEQGEPITALIVAFCAVIAPAGWLLCTLAVLLAVRRPPAPGWVGELLRLAEHLRPWGMLEVMMLGILVALIKIADLARVEAGLGMYAVFVLMLLVPAIIASIDEHALWERITWVQPPELPP